MLPPAPVLFSTTNCCPSSSPILAPMTRATMSVGPPAANDTMMRTGFDGYASSALAQVEASSMAITRVPNNPQRSTDRFGARSSRSFLSLVMWHPPVSFNSFASAFSFSVRMKFAAGARRSAQPMLIRVLPGGLDDRRPAIDLAQQHAFGGGRRRLVIGHRFRVDVVEALHQIRVLERGPERGRQLLDDGRRQSLWREQAVPHAKLKALQAGFVSGRQVRQRFQPRLGGHRVALHLLAQD